MIIGTRIDLDITSISDNSDIVRYSSVTESVRFTEKCPVKVADRLCLPHPVAYLIQIR